MKSGLIHFCWIVVVSLGCSTGASSQLASEFEDGRRLSELTDKRLKEVSGLAASVGNPGLLWAVNDHGNEPKIYLLDNKLNVRMTVFLKGATNRDWEDIVVGPGPDKSTTYIYVADIGDNDAVYPCKQVYRLAEPVTSMGDEIEVTEFDLISFVLEDGKKDAESLFIDAKSNDLFLVTKREEPVGVYWLSYPQSLDDTVTASRILSLPLTEIVAADRSKGGDIVMKNYSTVYYWKKNDAATDIKSLLSQKPKEVPYEEEAKGESIAWAIDDSGFFTLSEMKKKRPTYLYFYPRKQSTPAKKERGQG